MSKIKIILSTVSIFILFATGVVFNACTKDPCKKIICRNDGICRDGRCKCTPGFEGVNCELKMFEKFIGTWDGYYRCNGNPAIIITNVVAPGTKPNKIEIYNLFNQNVNILADVDVEKINIPSQTIGNITYSGTGDITGKYVTLFIQQYNNTTFDLTSCVYNATKYSTP
jgi:hypothetical protein